MPSILAWFKATVFSVAFSAMWLGAGAAPCGGLLAMLSAVASAASAVAVLAVLQRQHARARHPGCCRVPIRRHPVPDVCTGNKFNGGSGLGVAHRHYGRGGVACSPPAKSHAGQGVAHSLRLPHLRPVHRANPHRQVPRHGGQLTRYALFDRFTGDAVQALVHAQGEANRMGDEQIAPYHLLLGVVHSPGNARKAFRANTITTPLVSRAVVDLTSDDGAADTNGKFDRIFGGGGGLGGFGGWGQASGELPFSEYSKWTMTTAEGQSNKFSGERDAPIGPEHLLLALIDEEGTKRHTGDSPTPIAVLESISVDCEALRAAVTVEAKEAGKRELVGAQGVKESRAPTLDECGTDLTAMAREGNVDPVVGRDTELGRVIRILLRRRKNNPCLVGEPGVGKTAVAEALAQCIVDGRVPDPLRDRRVVSLELASLVAGTKYRGEFEERLQAVVKEASESETGVKSCVVSSRLECRFEAVAVPQTILLFVDELHTLVGAGSAEGGIDAANILKPALARGEMQVIGATTIDEYRKYIEKDAALERRFQVVRLDEPSVVESLAILQRLRPRYESHHRVRYSVAALEAAASLSDRYVNDRFLPDKAIDLMDEAGALVQVHTSEGEIGLSAGGNTDASGGESTEQADAKSGEEEAVVVDSDADGKPLVNEQHVASVLSEWTGVPVQRLTQNEKDNLLGLEDALHARVIGQEAAVTAISRAVRRARAGMSSARRPVASFVFAGPTGVGKTELAKALAEAYYGSEDAMVRLDMSEYMERHTVSRLVGSPPGYVGFDDGGQLTEAVRRKPHTVILMDEMEKAHPDVFNLLLQILDDGRLTDSKGRTVDFCNTLLILTSNVGSRDLLRIAENGAGADSDGLNDSRPSSFTDQNAAPWSFSQDSGRAGSAGGSMEASNAANVMDVEVETVPSASSGLALPDQARGGSKGLDDVGESRELRAARLIEEMRAAMETGGDPARFTAILEQTEALLNEPNTGLEQSRDAPAMATTDEAGSTAWEDEQAPGEQLYLQMKRVVKEALRDQFRPEFLNRLDEVVVFQPLRPSELRKVADIMFADSASRASSQGVKITLADEFRQYVASVGTDAQYGARPLRRAVQRNFDDVVAQCLLDGFVGDGDECHVEWDDRNAEVVVRCGDKSRRVAVSSDAEGIEDV